MCSAICDMATRLNRPTQRRTPLPLIARDLAASEKLREPGAEREAACAVSAPTPDGEVSEAFLVYAVFVAGLRAVREDAEERGYADLSAQEATSGEAAERRSGLVDAPPPSDRLRACAEASADTPQPISSPR